MAEIKPRWAENRLGYSRRSLERRAAMLFDSLRTHLPTGDKATSIALVLADTIEDGQLYIAAEEGFGDSLGEEFYGRTFPIERTLSGRAMREGTPQFLADVDSRLAEDPGAFAKVKDVGSAVALPLFWSDGTVYGAVIMETPKGTELPKGIIEHLQPIIVSGAQGIEDYIHGSIDHGTKLFNKRRLFEQLRAEHERPKKQKATGEDLSLIMFDIDKFKRYNDTHGHESGDELLEFLGWILNTHMGHLYAARYGGEEMVVISREPKYRAAQQAEVLRKLVEHETKHSSNRFNGGVTLSVGVANYTQIDQWRELHPIAVQHGDERRLIDIADDALFAAKGDGVFVRQGGEYVLLPKAQMRNKVCIWAPEKPMETEGLLVKPQDPERWKREGALPLTDADIVPGGKYVWYQPQR